MRFQNGFSLVEALVVGIIGSIIAGIFIAFMYVHNDVVNRGVAKSILMNQSETVSKTIATAVRSANKAIASYWQDTLVTSIDLHDNSGTPITRFFIGPNTYRLFELSAMNSLIPFKSGKDTVFTSTNSSFIISPDNKRVTLNIGYTINYRGKTYTINTKKDTYLCRN